MSEIARALPSKAVGSSRLGRSPGFRRPLSAFPVFNDQWLSARGPCVDHSGGATPDSHRLPYSPDRTSCPSGTRDAGGTNIGVTDCFSKCFLEGHRPDPRRSRIEQFQRNCAHHDRALYWPAVSLIESVGYFNKRINFGVNRHILKVAHNLTYTLDQHCVARRSRQHTERMR